METAFLVDQQVYPLTRGQSSLPVLLLYIRLTTTQVDLSLALSDLNNPLDHLLIGLTESFSEAELLIHGSLDDVVRRGWIGAIGRRMVACSAGIGHGYQFDLLHD